jgi:hypothetical protein
MNGQQLLDKLIAFQEDGHDLSKLEVTYRNDYDSDAVGIADLEEGYYDYKTNSILESIVLITNTEEV